MPLYVCLPELGMSYVYVEADGLNFVVSWQ